MISSTSSIEADPDPAVTLPRGNSWDMVYALHDQLAERYAALKRARHGRPVYAIEHGLSAADVERLRRTVGRVLRAASIETLGERDLPLVVVAAETGYGFNGLLAGYWPLLRSAAGLDMSHRARTLLSGCFDRAALRYGLKRPNDTPFARQYRHIAWPIANALAPRQLHGAIATMLRDVAVLVGVSDDDVFVRALRDAAARSGSDLLVEWAADEDRLLLLADAILGRDRSDLSPSVVRRLLHDLTAVPGAQAKVAEARRLLERAAPAPRPARLTVEPGPDGAWRLALRREPTVREDPRDIPAVAVAAIGDLAAIAKGAALVVRGPTRPLAHLFVPVGDAFVSWAPSDAPPGVDDDLLVLMTDIFEKHPALRLIGACAGGELYRVDGDTAARASLFARLNVPVRRGDGLAVSGGLRLGFGREFVSGIPIRIAMDAAAGRIRTIRADDDLDLAVPAGEALVVDGRAGVSVSVRRDGASKAEARIAFVDPAPADPAVTVRVDPPAPTVRDLIEGRLTVDLFGHRAFADLPVEITLALPGHPPMHTARSVALPFRLSAVDGLTAVVAAVRDAPHRPMSARLSIEYGVDRLDIAFTEPPRSVAFTDVDGIWQAHRCEDDERVAFRAIDATDPFAEATAARREESASLDTFRLLLPDDGDLRGGLVIGPRRLRGGSTPALPAPHRRLDRAGDTPGLKAEIAAWLAFRTADGEHALASAAARATAAAAERAVVATLCGERWATREGDGLPSPSAALVTAALASDFDLLATRQLPDGDRDEVPAFLAALERRFGRIAGLDGAFAGQGVSPELAGALDLAVEEAWEAVNAARAERRLPPLDVDPGAAADDWATACVFAADTTERPDLVRMILPRPLGEVVRMLPYAASAPADVALAIDRDRRDFGSLRRSARRHSADAIENALNLFLRPDAFAPTDWTSLAAGLLEDRMTSRAVRYAALRLRATAGG